MRSLFFAFGMVVMYAAARSPLSLLVPVLLGGFLIASFIDQLVSSHEG